jgi:ADP-ribosylglycohydrolase
MHDRRRGALLGLAVGDALGAAVEFSHPGTFEPVTGYRAGGPHGLEAGEWTDDTSMALALAASIAEADWDLHDQAKRYVRWWRHGHRPAGGLSSARALTQISQSTTQPIPTSSSVMLRPTNLFMAILPIRP